MKLFSLKDFDNTKWYVLEKLCQLIIGIYIVPKIFNSLGAYNLGQLEISKSIIETLSPFFFLGLSAICIRELIFKPKLKYYILGSVFSLRLLSFIVLSALLVIYTYSTNTNEITLIVLVLALSYLFKISDVIEYYFVAHKNYKYVFASKVTLALIMLGFQYLGVSKAYSIYYFAGILVLENLLQTIIYVLIITKWNLLELGKLKFSAKISKDLLKDAFPLLVSNFIIILYINIDNLLIKHYLGNEANGTFTVVEFLVIFIFWNFGAAFIYGLYPALAECYLKDKKQYVKRIKFMLKTIVLFGLFIGLFYEIFGDSIINNYYNSEYNTAKVPLRIYAWSPLFIFIGMLFEKHLLNQNQLKKNVVRFIIGCFSNLICCVILIPKYGLIGAAYSVLISHFVSNVLFILYFKSYRKQMLLYWFNVSKE